MNHLAALCFGLLLVSGVTTDAHAAPTDDADIRAVVETFRTAIINKDKASFAPLFLFETITWQSVMDDASLAQVKAKHPKAVKARFFPDQTWLSFIDEIVADPKRNEETFANITIDTDGDAAAVAFDYAYLYDGKETNHGREHWQLVRTDSGWKITAVTYSVILAAPAPQKK
jgi:hypothetical protein